MSQLTPTIAPDSLVHRRWSIFWVAFGLLSGLMTIWALASPLMSVPDEPAHIVRAASVVRGEVVTGASKEIRWQIAAEVPRWVDESHELTCFAFNPGITAECQEPLSADADALVDSHTSAGSNGVSYYLIVGLPSLIFSGEVGLYAMRIMSALFASALLAFMFMGITAMARWRWMFLGTLVSITPMVLYLGGSANPNAVELAATGSLMVTLLALAREPSTRRLLWERSAIVIFSVFALLGTRSISALWVLVAVAIALLLAKGEILGAVIRKPAIWVTVAASAALSLFAVWWFTRAQPTAGASVPLEDQKSFFFGFSQTLFATFDYATGVIGYFGWMDRPSPMVTYVLWTVAMGIFIVGGVVLGRGRYRLAVVALIVIVVLVPPIVQGSLMATNGIIWQGRYMLAIYLCLLAIAGFAIDQVSPQRILGKTQALVRAALVILAVGQIYTFVWVLRRYVVGGGSWGAMLVAPAWQPPLGWIGLTVLLTLLLGLSCWVVFRFLRTTSALPDAAPLQHPEPSARTTAPLSQ